MKVKWTDHAKQQRKQISDYIRSYFGAKRRKKFMMQVEEAVDMLLRYPTSGPLDPLFADRAKAYRSVIVGGRSKMVYFIDGDTLYIAAIWDCRQDPEEQSTQVG